MLKLAGLPTLIIAGLMAGPASAQDAATTEAPFTLGDLPYAADALDPVIDAETMTLHHDRHHRAYVDNLNKAVLRTRRCKA